MISLLKTHTHGMHRLISPQQTLEKLQSNLAHIGVTRCADVTGLDYLNIPVFCAIRPRGRLLQVANGKGLDPIAARVSAIMEAVEYFHYEHASASLRRASLESMLRQGHCAVEPCQLSEYRTDCFFTPDYVIEWEPGEHLLTGREVWLPASAVRIRTPMLYRFSNNGLASGNHLIEATLHAFYELIERDAVSRLSQCGRIQIAEPHCRCIDLDTVDDEAVESLIEKIRHADIKLVLIWVKSRIPAHTFWAVLLDKNPLGRCSNINIGYGTHLSTSVAATRAITEAAQSRLTFIHGAREDLTSSAYHITDARSRLVAVFDGLKNQTDWHSLQDLSHPDLLEDYDWILRHLVAAGYHDIFRVNMLQPQLTIPVVRVFVSGLECNQNLF